MVHKIACVVLMVCVLAGRGVAATYYCSPSGGSSDSGTVTDPFSKYAACVGNAVVTLVAGDTVLLRGGDYPTTVEFNIGSSYLFAWRVRDSVTYKAYPGEIPVLRVVYDPGLCFHNIMDATGRDGVTLDSLWFRKSEKHGIGLISGATYGMIVKNCNFDSTGIGSGDCTGDNAGAIGGIDTLSYMRGWIVQDNYFGPNCRGRGAIHVYGWDSVEVTRNFFDGCQTAYGQTYMKGGYLTNSENDIHHNIFRITSTVAFAHLLSSNVRNLRFHHNLVYGSGAGGGGTGTFGFMMNYRGSVNNIKNVYVYNNTFDMSGTTGKGFSNLMGTDSSHSPQYWIDSTYFFNNIMYRPVAGMAVVNYNDDNTQATPNGLHLVGPIWYSDCNAFVKRGSGDDIMTWWYPSNVENTWTLAEWQATSMLPGYTEDPNSISTTDTTNMFLDRGSYDYRLDPSGSNYTTLSSGGRGGSWPTYIGAFDPGTDTCPSINRDSPTNGQVTADITPTLQWDVTDPQSDSVTYSLLFDGNSTPTTVVASGTVATPANNLTYNSGTLSDRTYYYWRFVYSDTGCTETTSTYSLYVDTLKCPTVALVSPPNDTTLGTTTVRLTADFVTDGFANIIVRVYGQRATSPVTPTTLIHTDTLTTDSAGWYWDWTGRKDDSTYYWRVLAVDPDCVDTSNTWKFTIDSIPPGAIPGGIQLDGTVLEGTTIGKRNEEDYQTKRACIQRYGSCGVGDPMCADRSTPVLPPDLAAVPVAR